MKWVQGAPGVLPAQGKGRGLTEATARWCRWRRRLCSTGSGSSDGAANPVNPVGFLLWPSVGKDERGERCRAVVVVTRRLVGGDAQRERERERERLAARNGGSGFGRASSGCG